jgi:hypothetical protein
MTVSIGIGTASVFQNPAQKNGGNPVSGIAAIV